VSCESLNRCISIGAKACVKNKYETFLWIIDSE
jgi:hypothetical protein